MSNVLAIAHKELKGYFASPIAFVVIGLFALMFGYFFYALLVFFDRQSMQMAGLGGGAPSVNVNEQLIRPVFLNATVILLFVLPMVTMRTYSEEKRSGTIELLLTAPLTDFQIIAGKFLGAMGLYAAMLAVTIPHVGALFWLGDPEWIPIVISYVGLLLLGGCFISVGLLISSLTKNQIVAVMATFTVFLMLWVINWIASFTGPTTQGVLNYLSITDHLDDFTRGVVDTKHLIYYISFIAFGLYLTMQSVDTERWRG
jgi:ABC-2 type transport system permease protein